MNVLDFIGFSFFLKNLKTAELVTHDPWLRATHNLRLPSQPQSTATAESTKVIRLQVCVYNSEPMSERDLKRKKITVYYESITPQNHTCRTVSIVSVDKSRRKCAVITNGRSSVRETVRCCRSIDQ